MKKLVLFGDSNSIHTKKWVEMLIDNYEIHLISFSTNKISGVQNYNIPVGKINPTGGNYKYIFKIVKIRKLVRIINPVIINAHYLTSYGFIASIVGLYFMIKYAKIFGEIRHIISYSIFGISMILLYTASSLYHCL